MATRYWVGGSGTWQAGDTSHWSTTSGGAPGASVPTSADIATFNASSGGGVVTIDTDVPCSSYVTTGFTGTIECDGPTPGYISTYNASSTIGCGGNYRLRDRSTGTTARSVTIRVNCDIKSFEKLGTNTSSYSINGGPATAGALTAWYIRDVTTNSSGSLSVTNASQPEGVLYTTGTWNISGGFTLQGTISAYGYSTNLYSYAVINILGTAAAAFNYRLSQSGAVNVIGNANLSYSATDDYKPYVYTTNLYNGTLFLGGGATYYYTGTINVLGGYLTVSGDTSNTSVSRVGSITLSSGTLKVGGASGGTNVIAGDLTISGSSSKTLLYNDATNAYVTVNGNVYWDDSVLTFTNNLYLNFASTFNVTSTNLVRNNLRLRSAGRNTFLTGGSIQCNSFGTTMAGKIGFGIRAMSVQNYTPNTGPTSALRGMWYAYNQTDVNFQVLAAWSVSPNFTDFYGITNSGISVAPNGAGDCGKNSGITFPSPVTRYLVAGSTFKTWLSTTSWSATSGGATGASIPLVHDTAIIDANSGTSSAILNIGDGVPPTITSTNNNVLVNGTYTTYPAWFMKPLAVKKTAGTFFLSATGGNVNSLSSPVTNAVDTNNASFYINNTINQDKNDCIWSLSDTLYSNTFSIQHFATVNTNNNNIIAIFFSTENDSYGNFGSSSIAAYYNSLASSLINQSSTTYKPDPTRDSYLNTAVNLYKYLIDGSSTNQVNIYCQSTASIGELQSTRTTSYTITFSQSYNAKINKWSVSGSAGNLVLIRSDSDGTQGAITYTGSGVVSADYLDIKDSLATPSTSTWFAGTHSVNSGNNTGWYFTAPTSQGNSLFFGSNF